MCMCFETVPVTAVACRDAYAVLCVAHITITRTTASCSSRLLRTRIVRPADCV